LQDWRAKALEYFPDLRDLIEQERSPLSLWIELYRALVIAYDQQPIDEDRIAKIYEYASWCFQQPETGNIETDPSNGVAVSFIEDIPLDQRFANCEPILRFEELHQRPLHLPVPQVLSDVDLLLGKRVYRFRVKCCGDVSGQSGKVPCQSITNQQVQGCHSRHVNRVQVSECSANVDNGFTI